VFLVILNDCIGTEETATDAYVDLLATVLGVEANPLGDPLSNRGLWWLFFLIFLEGFDFSSSTNL
jgi:hypothetical protein